MPLEGHPPVIVIGPLMLKDLPLDEDQGNIHPMPEPSENWATKKQRTSPIRTFIFEDEKSTNYSVKLRLKGGKVHAQKLTNELGELYRNVFPFNLSTATQSERFVTLLVKNQIQFKVALHDTYVVISLAIPKDLLSTVMDSLASLFSKAPLKELEVFKAREKLVWEKLMKSEMETEIISRILSQIADKSSGFYIPAESQQLVVTPIQQIISIRKFHRMVSSPKDIIITVCGDNPREIEEAIDNAFGQLKDSELPLTALPEALPFGPAQLKKLVRYRFSSPRPTLTICFFFPISWAACSFEPFLAANFLVNSFESPSFLTVAKKKGWGDMTSVDIQHIAGMQILLKITFELTAAGRQNFHLVPMLLLEYISYLADNLSEDFFRDFKNFCDIEREYGESASFEYRQERIMEMGDLLPREKLLTYEPFSKDDAKKIVELLKEFRLDNMIAFLSEPTRKAPTLRLGNEKISFEVEEFDYKHKVVHGCSFALPWSSPVPTTLAELKQMIPVRGDVPVVVHPTPTQVPLREFSKTARLYWYTEPNPTLPLFSCDIVLSLNTESKASLTDRICKTIFSIIISMSLRVVMQRLEWMSVHLTFDMTLSGISFSVKGIKPAFRPAVNLIADGLAAMLHRQVTSEEFDEAKSGLTKRLGEIRNEALFEREEIVWGWLGFREGDSPAQKLDACASLTYAMFAFYSTRLCDSIYVETIASGAIDPEEADPVLKSMARKLFNCRKLRFKESEVCMHSFDPPATVVLPTQAGKESGVFLRLYLGTEQENTVFARILECHFKRWAGALPNPTEQLIFDPEFKVDFHRGHVVMRIVVRCKHTHVVQSFVELEKFFQEQIARIFGMNEAEFDSLCKEVKARYEKPYPDMFTKHAAFKQQMLKHQSSFTTREEVITQIIRAKLKDFQSKAQTVLGCEQKSCQVVVVGNSNVEEVKKKLSAHFTGKLSRRILSSIEEYKECRETYPDYYKLSV